MGCLAHIALLRDRGFDCSLCFLCFGSFCYLPHRSRCSGCSVVGIACKDPHCCGCQIPVSVPTGGLCRRRVVFRFARGPSWRRSPCYGRNHFVAARHGKVCSCSRSRPSWVALTLSGFYYYCGSRGVRLVCRADHPVLHPSLKVCPYMTTMCGASVGFWPDSGLPVFGWIWCLQHGSM